MSKYQCICEKYAVKFTLWKENKKVAARVGEFQFLILCKTFSWCEICKYVTVCIGSSDSNSSVLYIYILGNTCTLQEDH